MRRAQVSGHFLPGGKGPIFALIREPRADSRVCVMVVPPFAEEMNKSRRMITELALGLADRGVSTLTPDLYGTGDSGGEFADADWSTWKQDLATAAKWAAERGKVVSGILGIRLGCSLAASVVTSGTVGPVTRTVLWQPAFDGTRYLSQFLRLRIAAALMEQDRKETQTELLARLQSGQTLEVAGYELSGRLAADIGSIAPSMQLPEEFGHVSWMEIARELRSPLPAASCKIIDQTRASGGIVEAETFVGEPFWASTEVALNSDMLNATIQAFTALPVTESRQTAPG